MKGLFSLYALLVGITMVSCQKEEPPLRLPEKGDSSFATVEMGEDYVDQLFYDFESGSVVHISEINSWDLAFEASSQGNSIFMNGGADVSIYNTHEANLKDVITGPGQFSDEWEFDAPCGLPDSTAIGNWASSVGTSGSEVYIIKLNSTNNPNNMKKIKLLSVTSSEYVMEYADLEDPYGKTISIPKDENYNYSYFSFRDGGQTVQPDPPKNTWDIVFTRYRYIYRELDDFPYVVTGALLNPYNTSAFVDTLNGYDAVDVNALTGREFSNHRDAIGFSWKYYDIDNARYTVDQKKTYVIKTKDEQYWKLHFLDFYNKQGVKGTPSFEYQRLK